jgi:cation diffusion facilitator family transporter
MNDMSVQELYRQGRRAAALGFAVALVLGVAKLAGGWYGHSVALISDAIHSFGDTLLSAGVWLAMSFAEKPPDQKHPYGHARAEAVAGAAIALLLILSAFAAGWQSILEFGEPAEESPAAITLVIAVLSFVLNEAIYQRNWRVAERTGSKSLQATAWDQRLDAMTGLGILVALALAKFGGPAWRVADPAAGVSVAVLILFVGGRLFWDSFNELMDAQADPDLVEAVRQEASAVQGVVGVEKLFVRKAGMEYLVDIHLEVNPTATVAEGHAVAHAVKDRLRTTMAVIKDVLVHVEPAPEGAAGPPARSEPD